MRVIYCVKYFRMCFFRHRRTSGWPATQKNEDGAPGSRDSVGLGLPYMVIPSGTRIVRVQAPRYMYIRDRGATHTLHIDSFTAGTHCFADNSSACPTTDTRAVIQVRWFC